MPEFPLEQPSGCFFYGSRKQSGFSLLTIMLMVVSLAAGLAYFIANTGVNVQSQLNNLRTNQLVAQSQFIAQRITKCATDYPDGDNLTGFHIAYPAGSPSANVSTLTCPKPLQAPSTGTSLWTGKDGVYLPQPPDGFNAWTYTNDATEIKITITATTADPATLTSAATRIGSQATVAGSAFTLTILK